MQKIWFEVQSLTIHPEGYFIKYVLCWLLPDATPFYRWRKKKYSANDPFLSLFPCMVEKAGALWGLRLKES